MSSRSSLRTLLLCVTIAGAATLPLACGSDTEVAGQAGSGSSGRIDALPTETTTSPTVPAATETVSTTAEQAAARKRRQMRARQAKRRAAARKRARAETTPTETNAQPPPAKTTQSTPAEQPPPAPKPKPKPTGPPTHSVTENATLQLVSRNGARSYVHEGNVEGTLAGTMNLHTKLAGEGVIGTFTVTLSDGTIRGRASGRLLIAGAKANFKGTATILGGTGAYAKASGSGLLFSGSVPSDASTSTVRMSGQMRW